MLQAAASYTMQEQGQENGSDLHQKTAIKSTEWNSEFILNYLFIWQDEESLFNIMYVIFLIVPLKERLYEHGSSKS